VTSNWTSASTTLRNTEPRPRPNACTESTRWSEVRCGKLKPDNWTTRTSDGPQHRPSSPTTSSGWREGTGTPKGQAGSWRTTSPRALPSHQGNRDPRLRAGHPECHLEAPHLPSLLSTRRRRRPNPGESHSAAAPGDRRRRRGVGSGGSLGQPKNPGSTAVPREMEGIRGTNMGAQGEPGQITGHRRLPRALPPTACTGSARSCGNSSLKGDSCHGAGPQAAITEAREYGVTKCRNAALRSAGMRKREVPR